MRFRAGALDQGARAVKSVARQTACVSRVQLRPQGGVRERSVHLIAVYLLSSYFDTFEFVSIASYKTMMLQVMQAP